jgi:hypothetical protein
MASFRPTFVAFAPETTQGTPPADATAWNTNGKRLRVLGESLDLSSFSAEPLEDERAQSQILTYDDTVEGIKGGNEFPFEMYLSGAEAVADSGEQAVSTLFLDFLEHCLGGARDGYSDEAAVAGTHSSTAVEVTTVANFAVGDWVGLEDASGEVHHREVVSIAGDVLTLHRALPFTPEDGAAVHGCSVRYIDESVLEDSSVGPNTLSWLLQKGKLTGPVGYEARGCVSTISGITLDRAAVAKLAFTTMVGSWISPEAAPSPSWSTAQGGAAGLSVAPRTKVAIHNVATTTNTLVNAAQFQITPGITRTRFETQTETESGMPGTAGYGLDRAPCELSVLLHGHSTQHWTDFTNGQKKQIQFERNALAGKSWSIYFRRCAIHRTPTIGDVNNRIGNQLTYRALGNPDAATTIMQSRMTLVFC